MESVDFVRVLVYYESIMCHLANIRLSLPSNFEDKYISLRAVDQWLHMFREELESFYTVPF